MLNIGLQANILDTRVFSMFVVHALILTFMTTPLVIAFYPPKYRHHHRNSPAGEEGAIAPKHHADDERRNKFAVILDKIESLPAAMTFSQLLHSPSSTPVSARLSSINEKALEAGLDEEEIESTATGVTIEALRLVELTARTSAVIRSQEADALIYNDPVVTVYRTFGQLNHINVSANLSVVNHEEFPEAVAKHVADTQSEMVVIPWPRGVTTVLESEQEGITTGTRNPFDGVFHRTTTQDQTSSVVYSEFIRQTFAKSPSDIALFVDRGLTTLSTGAAKQHLFLAFFGGPDDRLALSFLVQLCENPSVTATVVKVEKTDEVTAKSTEDAELGPGASAAITSPTFQTVAAVDTVYGQHSTQTRLASDTADNILWDKYTSRSHSRPVNVTSALSRITFRTESTSSPLRRVSELVKQEATTSVARSGRTLIVLAGRSRRMAVESLNGELKKLVSDSGSPIGSTVPKTLGDVGAALVATSANASLIVLQAAPSHF